MKLLCFAGALRKDSYNKKFVREAMRFAREAGAETEFVDLKDYPMPPYDGDIESTTGIPETTSALAKRIAAADALIISTPEYNGSIPGILKNVVDWLSREKPVSLTNKPLLLLAASPGALGGVRSLWHTRVPFEVLGVHVFPNMMGLQNASTAFDEQGKLKEEKPTQQLKKLVEQFITHIRK
ncbi:MAG TPA: NAD(P)H-dependent oxidoreductase [Rickettsiales bacterium]|nr:NAD(P)H-dependent oxidoreductase [Rickettsiales bacterium]